MGPSEKLENALKFFRRFIPKQLFKALQPHYHLALAYLSAFLYLSPSKKIFVVGVTGTKGKTSTTELVNAILEKEGFRTALASTVRFKIGEKSFDNRFKMTTIGRAFTQRFLRRAVSSGCTHAVLEISSEAAKQYRHLFLNLDALIFTNLAPEHIESHGSYEKYAEAKLAIAKELASSGKKRRMLVVNADDPESERFLRIKNVEKLSFKMEDAEPFAWAEKGLEMTWNGEKISSRLVGKFSVYNILSAATLARAMGIGNKTIKSAVEEFQGVRGRLERVEAGQAFPVVVDYAHTPESLEQVYQAFPHKDKICVLGSTGGGRDRWKRPAMGAIANHYCAKIILTDEDPYDEDPRTIIEEMAAAIDPEKLEIEIDRRKAIRKAVESAKRHSIVIITGKGTDPFIMRSNGKKEPWSDVGVAREEIRKLIG